MAKRNRSTLKHFFQKGSLPTEHHFGDLIDSTLNMVDEGFDKSPEHGLEISPIGNHKGLISFFRNIDPKTPIWSIRFDPNDAKLVIVNEAQRHILTLDPQGKIGIGQPNPEWQLDVDGVLATKGRIGAYAQGSVPANGQWHRITEELSGCHAFEVMAGVGKKRTGNYALMHAFAVNTYNPTGWFFNFLNLKKRIRYDQAYYRTLGNKLKLRWTGQQRKYFLELRSNSDYGEGIRIRYSLTNLWFDEEMSESWSSPTSP